MWYYPYYQHWNSVVFHVVAYVTPFVFLFDIKHKYTFGFIPTFQSRIGFGANRNIMCFYCLFIAFMPFMPSHWPFVTLVNFSLASCISPGAVARQWLPSCHCWRASTRHCWCATRGTVNRTGQKIYPFVFVEVVNFISNRVQQLHSNENRHN